MAKYFNLQQGVVENKEEIHDGRSLCATRLYIGEGTVFSFSCIGKYFSCFPAYVVFTDQGRMLVADKSNGEVSEHDLYKNDARKISWSDWTSGKWIFKDEYSIMAFKGYEFTLHGSDYDKSEVLKLLQNTVKKYGN